MADINKCFFKENVLEAYLPRQAVHFYGPPAPNQKLFNYLKLLQPWNCLLTVSRAKAYNAGARDYMDTGINTVISRQTATNFTIFLLKWHHNELTTMNCPYSQATNHTQNLNPMWKIYRYIVGKYNNWKLAPLEICCCLSPSSAKQAVAGLRNTFNIYCI